MDLMDNWIFFCAHLARYLLIIHTNTHTVIFNHASEPPNIPQQSRAWIEPAVFRFEENKEQDEEEHEAEYRHQPVGIERVP